MNRSNKTNSVFNRRVLFAFFVLLACSASAYWAWGRYKADTASIDASTAPPAADAGGKKKGGRGGGPGGGDRPLPVSAVPVELRDIRLIQNSIGTATAKIAVTVRSRVDGELLRVNFKEGEQVKKGDLLAEVDPRPFQAQLDQVQGQLARDSALLENARIDLKRYQDLLAQDSISRQQVDTQAALVRQLEGTVQADKGAVANAKLQLDYTRIVASASGRVGLRNLDPGNQVKSSDANGLTTIAQLQPMLVVFTVPESRLPLLIKRMQAKAPLVVEAWDREQKFRLAHGRVISLDNQIDPTTGTIKVKAEFDNAKGVLFPNQFVNARMVLEERTDVVVVPTASVLQGSKGTFVYRVNSDDTVSRVPVEVGLSEGDWTEIQADLKPGDKVVRDGTDRIKDGGKVTLIGGSAPAKP